MAVKREAALAVVAALLCASLYMSQTRRVLAPVSAQPALYLVADTENELARLPARFTRLSDADEIAAGTALAASYLEDRGAQSSDDLAVQVYVAAVGGKLAAHAHRRLPYHFYYLPEPFLVDAFALPGGPVFVGEGLLARLPSEDALAAVLGHEIEHIDHYHPAERLQTEVVLRHLPAGELAGLPVAVFEAGYSKEEELEADREGVRLAVAAGYSARGGVEAMQALETLDPEPAAGAGSPLGELSQAARSGLEGYFASHPPTVERLAQIETMIARQPELAAAATQPLKVRQMFLTEQSEAALAAGQFGRAQALAQAALAAQPDYGPALAAVVEAELGQGKAETAVAACRALAAAHPLAAGAVAAWIGGNAEQLLTQARFEQLRAEALCFTSGGSPPAGWLRTLAWAQAGAGDQTGALATAQRLQTVAPASMEEFERDTMATAESLWQRHEFDGTARIAGLAAAMRRDNGEAWALRARAEFDTAEFTAAVEDFERAWGLHQLDSGDFECWADALATVRGAGAPAEFAAQLLANGTRLQGGGGVLDAGTLAVEAAGVAGMAAGRGSAGVTAALPAGGAESAHNLARAAWWAMRRGDDAAAATVLRQGLNYTPRNPELATMMSWVKLAQNKGEIGMPVAVTGLSITLGLAPSVGRALCDWQSGWKQPALVAWTEARGEAPQWLNASWRNALFPPATANASAALEAAWQQAQPSQPPTNRL